MIPRTIHQIWLGDKPQPSLVTHCLETVGRYHPQWSRIIWDETLLTAIGHDIPALLERFNNWASVTNFLRLDLLNRFGGFYLDVDVEAIASLDLLRNRVAVSAEQDPGRICNAIMGAVPRHPWVRWQLQNYEIFDPKDPASGVYLASAAPREEMTVLATHLFYPFTWDSPAYLRRPGPETILVHHWLGSWTGKIL